MLGKCSGNGKRFCEMFVCLYIVALVGLCYNLKVLFVCVYVVCYNVSSANNALDLFVSGIIPITHTCVVANGNTQHNVVNCAI